MFRINTYMKMHVQSFLRKSFFYDNFWWSFRINWVHNLMMAVFALTYLSFVPDVWKFSDWKNFEHWFWLLANVPEKRLKSWLISICWSFHYVKSTGSDGLSLFGLGKLKNVWSDQSKRLTSKAYSLVLEKSEENSQLSSTNFNNKKTGFLTLD